MADIARLAGVDISTVSRALAGSPRVTEETRKRIAEIVEDTGYVVNRSARMLRDGQAHQILVLIPDIAASFYPDVVKGVEEVAYDHGINVLLGSTMRNLEREADFGKQLLTGAVDGLLTITGSVPETIRTLPDYQRRIVALSRGVPDKDIPCVGIDNAAGTRDALQYLYGLGHRNILHISGPRTSDVFQARARAYEGFMREKGLSEYCRVKEVKEFSFASGLSQMTEVVSTIAPLPTAIFGATDELAIGAMTAARNVGLSIPEDISVMGFDDLIFSSLTYPALTTIHIPRIEIGRQGVTLLLDRMSGEPGTNISLPHELVIRDSCGPVS